MALTDKQRRLVREHEIARAIAHTSGAIHNHFRNFARRRRVGGVWRKREVGVMISPIRAVVTIVAWVALDAAVIGVAIWAMQ